MNTEYAILETVHFDQVCGQSVLCGVRTNEVVTECGQVNWCPIPCIAKKTLIRDIYHVHIYGDVVCIDLWGPLHTC